MDFSNNTQVKVEYDDSKEKTIYDEKGSTSTHLEQKVPHGDNHASDAATTRNTVESKISKRRIVDFSSGEEDGVPTYKRLTQNGGYLHTKSARLKISQANSGNVPWNKGKNRTSDAKAKISAGVRARNHAVLLKKLEKLGMTEEQWNESRRKIKLLREKVRKAKSNAAKEAEGRENRRKLRRQQEEQYIALRKRYRVLQDSEEEEEENKQTLLNNENNSECLSEPEVPSDVEWPPKKDNIDSKKVDEKQDDNNSTYMDDIDTTNDNNENDDSNSTCKDDIDTKNDNEEKDDNNSMCKDESLSMNNDTVKEQISTMPAIFVRDICWTPHPFDCKAVSYKDLCPYGGHGGLICCEICAANYTKFLSRSYTNLEQQRIAKVGTELKDLLHISKKVKSILEETLSVARTKPVPHRESTTETDELFYQSEHEEE
jgi:NUMOD3 motif